MADIATLNVKVTSSGIEVTNRDLQKLGVTADKTEQQTSKLSRAAKAVGSAFSGLSGILAGAGFGLAARQLADYTDRMASMQGQLKLVTGSQSELNQVYERALSLANSTGQSLESTVNLYARLARSTEELGLSQDRLFTITKAINQSFIVSGASATEASSAILQLSQGLAAGALRGEELNSVMENSPRLARALADGLGVTIGQLRQMGADGELTAERVTTALAKMADEIDAEFQDMPMTIGRSMQEIRNILLDTFGSVDADPIVDALENLKKTLSDPAMQKALQNFGAGLINLAGYAIKAAAGITDLANSIGEGLAKMVGGAGGASTVEGLREELADLNKEIAFYEKNGHSASIGVQKLREEAAKLETILSLNTKTHEKLSEVTVQATKWTSKLSSETKDYVFNAKEAAETQEDWADRLEDTADLFADSHDMLDELVAKNEDYIAALEWEVEMLGKTEREQFILNATRDLGTASTQAEREEVERLAATLYDHNAALEAAAEQTRAAEEAQKPFRDAITATIERIDGAFANAWKGAFDSFGSFKDSLVDAFKNLLAELAHLAITRPIVMSIGGAFGLGSSGASAAGSVVDIFGGGSSGGGGFGSIASGAGSIWNSVTGGITNTIGGAYSGASQFLLNQSYNLGTDTAIGGFLNDAGLNAGQMANASLGTMALTAGAGIVGGVGGTALGEKVFNKEAGSAWGATAGAAVGSIWGPVGAAVGGAIGGLVDAAFGSGKTIDNRGGRAVVDTATGNITTLGRDPSDPKFSQANYDAVQGAAAILAQYSQMVGGSGEFNIHQGDRRGVRLNGEKFATMSDAVAAGIRDLTSSAKDLDPWLKKLINGFQGTGEEVLTFADAMLGIHQMMSENPVDKAVQDFASAQEAAGDTLMTSYMAQVDALRGMIDEYDGSANAAMELNAAMAQNQQAAYQLAIAIHQISDSISATLSASAQNIRESVMTAEERDAANRVRRNELRAELGHLTDPDAISQTVMEINRLTNEIFGALPPDVQAVRAEAFASYLERVDEVAQRQLDKALENTRKTQEEIARTTENMLRNFSQDFGDSVEEFREAVVVLSQSLTGGALRAASLGEVV